MGLFAPPLSFGHFPRVAEETLHRLIGHPLWSRFARPRSLTLCEGDMLRFF